MKSVSVFWSGRGAHVRIHHEAFSPDVRMRIHPLDVAFAVVEYILRKVKLKIVSMSKECERLKVENRIDPQRLLTCPLSLHRELDLVYICISIDKL